MWLRKEYKTCCILSLRKKRGCGEDAAGEVKPLSAWSGVS